MNALLSYGLFAASILLLERTDTLKLFMWLVLLVAVYEATNVFFPVWIWEFDLPLSQLIALLLCGYAAGAVQIVIHGQLLFKHQLYLYPKNNS